MMMTRAPTTAGIIIDVFTSFLQHVKISVIIIVIIVIIGIIIIRSVASGMKASV